MLITLHFDTENKKNFIFESHANKAIPQFPACYMSKISCLKSYLKPKSHPNLTHSK